MDSLGIETHVGGQKIRDKQGQKLTVTSWQQDSSLRGSAEAIGCQLTWNGYVPWIGDKEQLAKKTWLVQFGGGYESMRA